MNKKVSSEKVIKGIRLTIIIFFHIHSKIFVFSLYEFLSYVKIRFLWIHFREIKLYI